MFHDWPLDSAGHRTLNSVAVSDMIIGEQPVSYTWNAKGNTIEASAESKQKELTLWCTNANGKGNGQSKTFTFYGLTTPHEGKVPFQFKVKYDPNDSESKTYKGEIDKVAFKSGVCTTIKFPEKFRRHFVWLISSRVGTGSNCPSRGNA